MSDNAKGATVESPTTTDANNGAESSPAQQDAKETKTIQDVVRDALEKEASQSSEEGQPEEDAQPAESQEGLAEKAESEPGEDADAPAGEVEADDAKTVPFHTHPRWKELRARERELSERVSKLEASQSTVEELKTYTGGEEGFQTMRVLARSYAEDPATAVPLLEQMLADARKRGGLVVQSEDIAQKVKDGLIDEESAVEIEQARINRKRAEEAQREGSEAQFRKGCQDAIARWEEKASEDPDWQYVRDDVKDRLELMVRRNGVNTPEHLVQMAREALKTARERLQAVTGVKRTEVRPGVRSSAASAKASPAPRTTREAVERALSGAR